MSELGKPFKKLVEVPATSLLRLPAWVRGYGDEMLRVASRPSGRICDTASVGDVAFAIRAHADEEQDLAEAIELLLAEGSLELRDNALFIVNFPVEQKNYEAARKQAQRDKDRGRVPGVPIVPDSPAASGRSGNVPQEERRSEETRSEDPPLSPEGGGKKKRGSQPRVEKTAVDPALKANAETLTVAQQQGVNIARVLPEFIAHARAEGWLRADWQAALQGWILRAPRIEAQRGPRIVRAAGDEDARADRNNAFSDAQAGLYGATAQAEVKRLAGAELTAYLERLAEHRRTKQRQQVANA